MHILHILFCQSVDETGCGSYILSDDIIDLHIAQYRRTFIHRVGSLIPHILHLSILAAEIIHIEDKGAKYLIHNNIRYHHIFYGAAPLTTGLYTDTAVGLVEDTVGNGDVANTAAHLRTDYYTTMTMDVTATDSYD